MKFEEIKNKIDGVRSTLEFTNIRKIMYDSTSNGDITINEYRTLLDLLYDEKRIVDRAKHLNN